GAVTDQDQYFFTGSVIRAGGIYHFYYCGHNQTFQQQGKPAQAIMHATSKDLLNWQKQPEDTLYAHEELFEPHDWRDPYVFWNADAGEYWMLVTARLKVGLPLRKGCLVLFTSPDLAAWTYREVFWAPNLYINHECSELFRMGDYWYLLYSTYSERFLTHYRMSRSIRGPWVAPFNDTFDGRAFYAAKTVAEGDRRFILGWLPSRQGERDGGRWEWGGHLVAHEIMQERDGTLSVKMPESLDTVFRRREPFDLSLNMGARSVDGDHLAFEAEDSFAFVLGQKLPQRCRISVTLRFSRSTKGCGLILRASDDLSAAYFVRIEPERDRLVLDRSPRDGDLPYAVELERPIRLEDGARHRLTVVLDTTICLVYLDDRIAVSTRFYDHREGRLGMFCKEGTAEFFGMEIHGE
ncbi:MAG: DUF4975 domain-containing protein, partial [Planctomycetaceae bacterium]